MPIASEKVKQAVIAFRRHWKRRPYVGIILGTGLGEFAGHVDAEATIHFEQLPHFCPATALSHTGRFVCGLFGDMPVVVMDGRYHRYEGHSMDQVTFPVRVLKGLGTQLLVLSNASGGLNPRLSTGDVVVIEDHINLVPDRPLCARRDSHFRNPEQRVKRPYDEELIERALAVTRRENIAASRGIYAAVLGPNYETRAEYRFLRKIGADVVGMSTVPEVLAAASAGFRVLALSVVTNACRPDALSPTDGAEVVAVAARSEPKVRDMVLGFLDGLELGSPP